VGDKRIDPVIIESENEEEEEQCREAMEGCPVEAIGDDGGE
jgi:ferredoxin